MRIVILGAAGRDFHEFLVRYRDDPAVEVVAFTAAQIPYIDDRRFPASLAGPRYPEGIPIVPESSLEALASEQAIDAAVFAYSDVSNDHIARLAARVQALGLDFVLPSGRRAMVRSSKPVISVCAVRTGCGKSQVARYIHGLLLERGVRCVGIRHPMPYGDLAAQRVQRFGCYEDLAAHACTIEEREEYEPYLEAGRVVYAGVDYAAILAEAEAESDVVLWDGGNNDLPFIAPDLHVVLLDPMRPGDAERYYPSGTQLRTADVILLAKAETASAEGLEQDRALAARVAPGATVISIGSRITLDGQDESTLAGKRVVCVEDGPTTTHGGMTLGAATLLARRAGAEIIDPRPFLQGELQATFAAYPGLGALVPAMGYSPQQLRDLQATIEAVPADLVLAGTPIALDRLIESSKPVLRARYDMVELGETPALARRIDAWLSEAGVAVS